MKWNEFKIQHNCKLIRVEDANYWNGMTFNDSFQPVFLSDTGKKTWICDDGVTYCRNQSFWDKD